MFIYTQNDANYNFDLYSLLPNEKMKSKNPYSEGVRTWVVLAICLGVLVFHYVIYRISISNEQGIREIVDMAAGIMGRVIPGASSYEYLNRPFHVPYLQLAASILVSIPLSAIFLGGVAGHTISRKAKNNEKLFDLRLGSVLFLVLGSIILLLPPSGFGGVFHSGHFGVLAPFRYSVVSVAMGFFLRIMFFRQLKGCSDV